MKKALTTIRDFSGGQIDASAMRADEREEYKTGCRILSDWRIEPGGAAVPRPGRQLLALTNAPRKEYARLGSKDYAVAFSTGTLTIYDLSTNLPVATSASPSYLWTNATVGSIYLTVCDNQIVICFPGMRPQLAIFAPTAGTWTFGAFAFRTITSQSQQPFYRAGNLGATMAYDAVTGAVNLTCSQVYFTAAMVGNILSILGQQVTITSVVDGQHATGQIAQRLPDFIVVAVSDPSPFQVGQIVEFQGGALKMEVTNVASIPPFTAPGQTTVTTGQVSGVLTSSIINTHAFAYGTDILVSSEGIATVTGLIAAASGSTVEWQEQFMGASLGWPQACGFDRSRLIFFDFPQKPGAVLWSATGAYDVFWIDSSAATLNPDAGTEPDDAILEFIPEGPRVRHVIGWGDEFVFTDKGIYDIPIAAAGDPLQPGSVEFRQFSNDGVAGIVPIKTQDAIVYINAGGKRASVVIRTGSYTNPYTSDGASDLHVELFTGPIALTVAPGDGPFPQRLIYVLNADGSIVFGQFSADKKFVGWQPWYSASPPTWLFCSGPTVYYAVPVNGASWLAAEAAGLYLDGTVFPNALPTSFPPKPAGDGPLTMLAAQTVTLMDGALDRGERQIDANGNIIPQGNDDNLTSATLAVGSIFTPKMMPFVPAAAPGESVGQRQHRRKVSRAMVTAEMSSGFRIGTRQVSPYEFGDDESQAPPLRTQIVQTRPIGRSFDPGVLLVKDRPGPLRIVEFSTEATI